LGDVESIGILRYAQDDGKNKQRQQQQQGQQQQQQQIKPQSFDPALNTLPSK
jgi:hypothetical protein